MFTISSEGLPNQCINKNNLKLNSGNVNVPMNYLQLTGGTLTGQLIVKGQTDPDAQKGTCESIKLGDDTSRLILCGGSTYDSAHLVLDGKDNTEFNIAGGFALSTGKIDQDKPSPRLTGLTNGSLTWNHKPVLTLIDSYRSGAKFYRKYSDGWIEQGGDIINTSKVWTTVTLHTAMATNSYMVLISDINNTSATDFAMMVSAYQDKSATTFLISTNITGSFFWYVCGY